MNTTSVIDTYEVVVIEFKITVQEPSNGNFNRFFTVTYTKEFPTIMGKTHDLANSHIQSLLRSGLELNADTFGLFAFTGEVPTGLAIGKQDLIVFGPAAILRVDATYKGTESRTINHPATVQHNRVSQP